MFYIDFLYEFEKAKVICVPNRTTKLNLTNTYDL